MPALPAGRVAAGTRWTAVRPGAVHRVGKLVVGSGAPATPLSMNRTPTERVAARSGFDSTSSERRRVPFWLKLAAGV
jgi:hypothetical protein